jgi:P4 family phage/plasmid primase-like protien
MRLLYHNLGIKVANNIGVAVDEETSKKMMATAQKYQDVCDRLGKTTEKQNIIKEARSMFFDEDRNFLDNLNTNGYLLCFNNGVIDFNETDKSKLFRKGCPEDNISFCTNIDYIPLDKTLHKKEIDEINEFMSQLFPEVDVRNYMWDHLSSSIIGVQREESFHNYIGCGRNGKSKLIDLMKMCMGDYKTDVPVSLITTQRGKIGGCAPEIQLLKGVRYAIMSEPSKGERINDGVLKLLTGGDMIEGRGLYQEKPTKFVPQYKLCCLSNQYMNVTTQDEGTWRRLRVVPFKSKFVENPVSTDIDNPYQFPVDTEINKKFDSWKEIFMSMLVERAFITKGVVHVSECIRLSSGAYRESQDYIAEFIRDKVVLDKHGKIKKTELNSEFAIWYQGTYGRGGPPPKDVHAYMDKAYGKSKQVGCWMGVKIRYERDEMDDNSGNNDDDIEDDINLDDL